MKLSLSEPQSKQHDSMVYSVCWNPLNNELISIGDDKELYTWHMNNVSSSLSVEEEEEYETKNTYLAKKVFSISHQCIATAWCPDQSFMASAFVDGSLRMISFDKSSSNLKLDKTIDNAHRGAVTCLAWNSDGTALISGGEDGVIKQWSRSGNLRAKLFQSPHSIHSIAWSPNNQSIVYASDRFVGIQSVQGKKKKCIVKKWKAHAAIVLCLDWNAINKLIVSGGEDCYYRIWDEFGRLMYCSNVVNYPITTVSWAPNGKYFSVGSYNKSLLCDYQGWIYQTIKHCGSALSMNWTQDSTRLAIGYANGEVIFGQVTNQSVLHGAYHVTLTELNQIILQNILSPDFEHVYETLEFNESVINFSIRYDYLIVITATQCCIYHMDSVTTPHIVSLKQGTVVYVIIQTPSFFVLVNSTDGISVIGYEGKSISQCKYKLLNAHNICATSDTLSVIDGNNPKCIHLIDPFTSQTLSQSIQHSTNIIQISLNISTTSNARKLAFIDCNKDLFIIKPHHHATYAAPFKLKTIVDCVAWHPDCDLLFALADKQLIIWYYPDIVWCDIDLLAYSIVKLDTNNIGNNAQIISIQDTLIRVRKENGDEEMIKFSALPLTIYEMIRDGKWDKALRLCHICNEQSLWGALTGLAIDNGQIEIALQGLTALEEPDKILFIKSIQNLPLQSHKDAQLALYRTNIKSAENILLHNDLIYRAIELNLRLLKFERALQIAVDHNTHLETVIGMRNKYLQEIQKEENIELFVKYNNEIEINWSAIEDKCRHEIDKEYQMAGISRSDTNGNEYNLPFVQNSTRSKQSARKQLEVLLSCPRIVYALSNIVPLVLYMDSHHRHCSKNCKVLCTMGNRIAGLAIDTISVGVPCHSHA
eukprot:155478_1